MSDATKKNFEIIRNVMNEQSKVIRELQERIARIEGNIVILSADIQNTKQLAAHLSGRGMGSTVHN